MHWGNPQLLWLLLVWPVFAILGWLTLRRRARIVARLGQDSILGRLYPASVQMWRRRRLLLLILALILLNIAAARPQYGRIEQTMRSFGTHVVVAVDVSQSMKAEDVKPSRLEKAKESLTLLLRRMGGNRVGIVAFAGTAFLQCPMTIDHQMATLVLQSLDTDSVGVAGTNIGEAIDTAVDAFERGGAEGGRALVLLTDGEDHQGRAEEAARRAANYQVRIYGIGLGTERGAPIIGNDGRLKEDRSGAKVNTQLRMDMLRSIAEITGGEAFEAGDSPLAAVATIAQLINEQEKSEFEESSQVIHEDRFQWFLAPALGLLLLILASRPESTPTGRRLQPESS